MQIKSKRSYSTLAPVRATTTYGYAWWLPLSEIINKGCHVILFADPAQHLYQREFELPDESFLSMAPDTLILFRNYRNVVKK